MIVKHIAKNAYNQSADLWHKSRVTTMDKFDDPKLLKQNRPHIFVEKPAMYSKVPDLTGKTVLCLGCGSGEECEYIISKNPKKLIGVDISEELIKIAKSTYPNVEFFVMDAENLNFSDESFDFIYCSLMMDYFETWDLVLKEINRILKHGGTFLFSNLHPVKWGAKSIIDSDGKASSTILGYGNNPDTGEQEVYGDYLNTSIHSMTWMKNISLSFYTKSISTMFKEITANGLIIKDILEPKPIEEAKKLEMSYWATGQKIPNFIIFETTKE